MRELLLCPPDYYGIEYEINPWMSRARGAEAPLAQEQWKGLHDTLSKLGLQDPSGCAATKPSRHGFHSQRRADRWSQIYSEQFPAQRARRAKRRILRAGWKNTATRSSWLPNDLYFEGEGDALFSGDALFCGYKFRSDINPIAPWLRCSVVW